MRKTLIALFAVPALAGFAFAAGNGSATQIVIVSIPYYLNLSSTVIASTFNFNDAGTTDVANALTIANGKNYGLWIEGSMPLDTLFAPSDGGKTTVSVKTNAKGYMLTVQVTAMSANSVTAITDLKAYSGALVPNASTQYASFNTTAISMLNKANQSNWTDSADLYLGLLMKSNATFDFQTGGLTAINESYTVTYSLTKL